MTCQELEKLSNEELIHEPEYTEEFNQMTEEEREKIDYDEERQYIKNPELEDKFDYEIRVKKGNHFKTCTDPNCQRLLEVWGNEKSLKEFVQN